MSSQLQVTSVNEDGYILGRDYTANSRLNNQFALWYDGQPVLHPKLPTHQENLRVADIGAGTAIWMIHASRLLPASARIDGFDISLDSAPPQEWLPSNITLYERNMLEPIPAEFVGQYDIVHLQLFAGIVGDKDPAPILENFLKLLKPGGYIVWSEFDFSVAAPVFAGGATREDDHFWKAMKYMFSGGDPKADCAFLYWPARMPKIFGDTGLTDITVENRLLPREMLPLMLDSMLFALSEMCSVTLSKMGKGIAEKSQELIQMAAKERKRVGFNVGRLTVIGQKPTR